MSGILTFLAGGVLGSGGAGPVTANLTFMIDMNNPSSWPGYGNTIYNISNTQNAVTNMNYISFSGSTSFHQVEDDTTSGGAVIIGGGGASSGGKYLATWNGTTSGSPLGTTSNSYTLEIWTRWAGNVQLTANGSLGNRLAIFGEKFGNPDQIGYEITMEDPPGVTSNTVKNATYNGVYNYTAANAAQYRPYPGQWYHIVATQTPINSTHTTNQLYINGNLADDAIYTNWQASGLEFRIGQALSNENANSTANIAVAVARTYNRGLGQAEVVRNYNNDKGRFVGGSLSFDGTSYLQAPAGQFDNFNTTDNFTIEFWANFDPLDTDPHYVLGCGWSLITDNVNSVYLQMDGGLPKLFVRLDSQVVLPLTATGVANGTWAHYAIVKSSTALVTVYVNGVALATYTASNIVPNCAEVLRIGASGQPGDPFRGKITGFRITRLALYTSNFTPPTLPYNSDQYVPASGNCTISLLATDNISRFTDSSPQATPLTITQAAGTTTWSNSTPYTPTANLLVFGYTGALQQWTVPNDVTSVEVAVVGAAGSWSSNTGTPGIPGGGAAVISNITVTPGETLYMVVGGQAPTGRTPAYGYGGNGGFGSAGNGGAGGGLSGIFTTSTPSQANAIIIAGGGGGVPARSGAYDGGDAGGSNAAFEFYGSNTIVSRNAASRGDEAREDLYGINGGSGGVAFLPLANAVANISNNSIQFNYAGSFTNIPFLPSTVLIDRVCNITSGTSTGNVYTVNYTGTGSTTNIVYVPGQFVRIAGANNANFNGNWTVQTAGTNTFTFIGTVENGGSANALGNVRSQFRPTVVKVEGADNANYNGTWSVVASNTTSFTVLNYGANPGTWTGSNGTVSAGGAYGNVFDQNVVYPTQGGELFGGNGGNANPGQNGGGGGGAGYWGGGGGAAGGDAAGAGGGGASYWQNSRISNVYYVGTNDIVGNLTSNPGNGVIVISY